LAETKITGIGLEKLRGMSRLNVLNIMGCSIYDKDIEVFMSMYNLRVVYARDSALTNFGIQSIVTRFSMLAIFI